MSAGSLSKTTLEPSGSLTRHSFLIFAGNLRADARFEHRMVPVVRLLGYVRSHYTLAGATSMVTVGSRIRSIRIAKRISIRSLARIVGISPTYLSHIEIDRVPPPAPDKLYRIAAALDLDPLQLVEDAGRWDEHAAEIISTKPHLRELFSIAFAMDEDELAKLVEALDERKVTPQEACLPL